MRLLRSAKIVFLHGPGSRLPMQKYNFCTPPETFRSTENEEIEEIYKRLRELEAAAVRIGSPEDLEGPEQEIMGLTNHPGALLLQKKLQAALDSDEQQQKEAELIRAWPGRMKSEGYGTVSILTVGGFRIEVKVRYYRRTCDRRNNKRHKGVYGGLILLGIHDRCTPGPGSNGQCPVSPAEFI